MVMTRDDYRSSGPELLIDLVDKTTAMLVDIAHLPPDVAGSVAKAIADALREDWGGQQIYIPKGLSIDATERGYELYSRWDGTTVHLHELAKEFGFSVQWAYRIVKAVRAADVAKRQADLFPDQ